MIDINALRAEWVKNGLRQKDVASMIGVNPKTLSLKLKKGVLGSDEIDILMTKLKISEPMKIFLNNK